jgi:hypothetical protein
MTAGDVQGALADPAPDEDDEKAPEQTVPPTQPGG